MTVTHATVRAAGPADVEHILAEYCKALRTLPPGESANLLWRPYQEFRAAVENGLFFVIEDTSRNFMAGAGVFDLANPGEKELGMCYIESRSGGATACRSSFCTSGSASQRWNRCRIKTRASLRLGYPALITGLKPANATSGSEYSRIGIQAARDAFRCVIHGVHLLPDAPCSRRRAQCSEISFLADARRREVIEKYLQMETWSRTKNGHRLVVALKVRHLLDPDCREALQDAIDELWRDELRRDELQPG